MNQSSQPLEFNSGFKPDKSNCRKLLKQSIIFILQCFFNKFLTSFKDIRKSKKIHITTSEVFRNLQFNSGLP